MPWHAQASEEVPNIMTTAQTLKILNRTLNFEHFLNHHYINTHTFLPHIVYKNAVF